MQKEYIIETEKVKSEFKLAKNGKSFEVRVTHKDSTNGGGIMGRDSTPQEYAAKGGTSIYCPSCQRITKCEVDTWVSKGIRNWKNVKHSDVQWFRRRRMCRTCFYSFNTAEVQESFLNELVRLRDAIVSGKTISADDLSAYGDNIYLFPNNK